MTVNYREGYGIFACNGILFNHESPRRGETFVTRKITRAVANILAGNQQRLYLGNLNSKRDWGFAPEYIEMQWLMLQQDEPDDYVIGTGESHSIREFVDLSFGYVDVEIDWRGTGSGEKGYVRSLGPRASACAPHLHEGDVLIEVDPRYFRPTEVDCLQADITKAKEQLGWHPRTTFEDLVKVMTDYDLKMVKIEPPGEGVNACLNKGFEYTNHDFSLYQSLHERG
jgi:GDPmannose 4,6-dehydratase